MLDDAGRDRQLGTEQRGLLEIRLDAYPRWHGRADIGIGQQFGKTWVVFIIGGNGTGRGASNLRIGIVERHA